MCGLYISLFNSTLFITRTVWSESLDSQGGWGNVNVIFDRTESAKEIFENSQNIAHLPRNMCKKNQLDQVMHWSSVRVFVRGTL